MDNLRRRYYNVTHDINDRTDQLLKVTTFQFEQDPKTPVAGCTLKKQGLSGNAKNATSTFASKDVSRHTTNLEHMFKGVVGYEKKVAKISSILYYLNRKFAEIYTPHRELSIDESLLLWKGYPD
jgi:hypothetical protein